MKAIILQEDEFNNIIKRLDEISKAILDMKKHDEFITQKYYLRPRKNDVQKFER